MKKNKYSGYKDIFEVQKYILNTFDVCEIDYDKKNYQRIFSDVKNNAVNMFRYENKDKSEEEIPVLGVELIRNSKSECFYQYEEKEGVDFSLNSIYVFLVPEIDYIECNCSLLQRNLYLYQGIREYDIENQTYKFDFYNRLLEENGHVGYL